MAGQAVNAEIIQPSVPLEHAVSELSVEPEFLSGAAELSIPAEKNAIRNSLKASTLDGVFATIFSNITGGVLLSNFLVELHATPTQIGMLSSIPMLANLLQPIGAYLGDRTTSRHWYCFWVYGPSRLLWLVLLLGIAFFSWGNVDSQTLVVWTLVIMFVTHFGGALGSAAWLSWMATLVPRRLRGRYFGFRNSAASLTNLLSVPLLGWLISSWTGGLMQAYSILIVLGVVSGLISLGFQFLMVDVNPQLQRQAEDAGEAEAGKREKEKGKEEEGGAQGSKGTGEMGFDGSSELAELVSAQPNSAQPNSAQLNSAQPNGRWGDGEAGDTQHSALLAKRGVALTQRSSSTQNSKLSSADSPEAKIQPSNLFTVHCSLFSLPPFLKDTNFLLFLLYFAIWGFAVNLSSPFFNLYMLGNLSIDLSWVTIYNSLQAGANLLMLILWGKIADRVGNRIILLTVGVVVAVTPLFWMGTSADDVSLWVWFPLLHILAGVTWAGIDLCNNNLQLGVAPVRYQATYFAIAAAVAGVSGAVGTTAGGFLAEFTNAGGISGVFALSTIVRLVALLPLVLVHEQRGQSLHQIMQILFPMNSKPASAPPTEAADADG